MAAFGDAWAKLAAVDEADVMTWLSLAMVASGVLAFAFLVSGVEAPYGKYADKAHPLYGFKMNGKLAWVLQEAPSFLLAAAAWWAAVRGADASRAAALTSLNSATVLLALYLLHYANRSFVYPLRIRGGKPTPFVVFLMAFAFCCVNGYLQGGWLARHAPAAAGAEGLASLTRPHFVVGVALFFTGMAVNWQADDILRNLRKPGETGYKIPRGGAFEFVSGANFFGEILEWAGFALAGASLPAAAFAAFTFCNIAPRGAQHHAFYVREFKDKYPPHRRAVIPFLW